jgi:hypothetical protein
MSLKFFQFFPTKILKSLFSFFTHACNIPVILWYDRFQFFWICTGLMWPSIWFGVNMITNLRVLRKENNFLIIWTTLRFLDAFFCVIYGYKYFKNLKSCLHNCCIEHYYFFYDATHRIGPRPPHYRGCAITLRHTRTHTHTNTYSVGLLWTSDRPKAKTYTSQQTTLTRERRTSMRSAGLKPAITARKRPQTHSLERAATGIGWYLF